MFVTSCPAPELSVFLRSFTWRSAVLGLAGSVGSRVRMETGGFGVGKVGLHAVTGRVAHGRSRAAEETENRIEDPYEPRDD